jgi:His-Xaa-Ser system radical SAM maturase HxsB
MSRETATRALDLVFRSPAKEIKIEFQGGEPLLNVELIQFIIEEAQRRNVSGEKEIEFVVTSNLAFLTNDILHLMKTHNVLISTSLDGPAFLHNANRPRPGNNSYELTIEGLKKVRDALGPDRVSAIMTTTRLSLQHPRAIVDEYIAQGFDAIFLRPISPYGFALRSKARTGYEIDTFLEFYWEALDHIIEVNRSGRYFVESYAQLLLNKILTPFATGYVDLQSPAGAGIGVAVYNYDGDVYPTDEARMLLEMGDPIFKLGNVHQNTYEEIFGGETLRSMVTASCIESLPGCAECPFQTYCGCDPVENYATQGTMFGHRPTSTFHKRNYEIIKHLLRLYHNGDPFIQQLFWSWVQNKSAQDLVPVA